LGEGEQVGTSTAKGMYHLFLGNTSYALLVALSAVIVGRVLGPDGYGLYTVALIVPPFLFNTIRLGLDSAATRYASRLRSEGREKEASAFAYSMAIFEIGVAAAFVLVFVELSGVIATYVLNRPQLGGFILPLAMVSVVGQAAFTVLNTSLTGLGKFKMAGVFQSVQGLTRIVVSASLVLLGFGVAGAIAGYTVAFFVAGTFSLIFVVGMSGASIPKSFRADVSTGLQYGFPVYLSILSNGVVPPVINTLLAFTVSNPQIGGYSAAYTFNTLISLFTYPITAALFPLFSRKVEDHASLARTYRTAVWFTALLVLPVVFFILAFSGPLIVTFYGRAYSFGSGFLALFAILNLFAGVGNLAWNAFLNGTGHTKDALTANIVGSVVDVAAVVPLIIVFGVVGAIIGQIIGSAAGLIVATILVKRRLQMPLGLTRTWKVYASAGVAAVVCYPISWLVMIPQVSVAAGAVAFVFLFIPLLAAFRSLSGEDIVALRGYLGFSKLVSRPLGVAVGYYEQVSRLLGQ
jgi:O-antigen/teichoic acid export membrane protein